MLLARAASRSRPHGRVRAPLLGCGSCNYDIAAWATLLYRKAGLCGKRGSRYKGQYKASTASAATLPRVATIMLFFFVFYPVKNSHLCCFLFHFVMLIHPLFSLILGHLCSPLAYVPVCALCFPPARCMLVFSLCSRKAQFSVQLLA